MLDSWHLDSLVVTQLPSQRQWTFKLGNWVPKEGVTIPAVVRAPRTHGGALRANSSLTALPGRLLQAKKRRARPCADARQRALPPLLGR